MDIEDALRKFHPHLPGSVKHRFLNTLQQFHKSSTLFDIDKEMSSFRAITGEEEAATTIMECIKLRGYPEAHIFNTKDHRHKVAVAVCVMAIGNSFGLMLKSFNLIFDFSKRRIDVNIPLSNFNVDNGDDVVIQPVEPLGLIHSIPNSDDNNVFRKHIDHIATSRSISNIEKMVELEANNRNLLLYASDSAIPVSKFTREGLHNRKQRALAMLSVSVMILQCREHLSLVQQAIVAFKSAVPEKSLKKSKGKR